MIEHQMKEKEKRDFERKKKENKKRKEIESMVMQRSINEVRGMSDEFYKSFTDFGSTSAHSDRDKVL